MRRTTDIYQKNEIVIRATRMYKKVGFFHEKYRYVRAFCFFFFFSYNFFLLIMIDMKSVN